MSDDTHRHTGNGENRWEGPMHCLGITLPVMIVAAGQEAPPKADPTPQEVRAAILRSLLFLESEGVA